MRPADARAEGLGPVFLHSMWRTGSSYLLSKFSADRYLCFYEPFNGELSSRLLRGRATQQYQARRQMLRHPAADTPYFAIYERNDPATRKPLWTFAHPRLPLADVYNDLSRAGQNLLAACTRVASLDSQVPVFGFCHSGTQIAAMRRSFAGRHVYLSRDPRSQFASYSPHSNDFFIAGTLLQLLSSAALHRSATGLVSRLRRYDFWMLRKFIATAPHRHTMRLGRMISKSLTPREMYALFFLSWAVSNRTGRQDCDMCFSLVDLRADELRGKIETDFAISLEDLRPNKPPLLPFTLDFAAIEQQVEARLAADGQTI